MNRRNFIQTGAVGITAIALAPHVLLAEPRHVLCGDGVHDDTRALQAWGNGQKVYLPNGELVPARHLEGGAYRITSTIKFRGDGFTMEHNDFHLIDNAILDFTEARNSHMSHGYVRGGGVR